MFCFKCGKENPDNSQFCGGCGANMTQVGGVQPQQPVPPVQTNAPQPQIYTSPAQAVAQPITQPIAQPIQPQYAGPNQGGLSKGQMALIIGLLVLLLGIIVGGAIYNKSDSKKRNQDGSRTIMIYMSGSNLESEAYIVTADLASINPSKIDLEHTNVLLYAGGTKEWHNFIKNDENALYKLTENGFEKVKSYPKKNMGDAANLTELLTYGYENFDTTYYTLMFYDHGLGILGAIADDFTDDYLEISEFTKALKDSPFNSKNKLDDVIFRTCLNGSLEVSTGFVDYANYVVASEEVTLGAPTSNVLGYFLNDLDPSIDGLELGKRFIDSYYSQMHDIDKRGLYYTTYSIIDLSKISNVTTELGKYINTIDINKNYQAISTIRGTSYQYGDTATEYNMIDLKQFVIDTKPYSSGDASKLLSAIDEAVVYNKSNLSKSHGLSVYFPYNKLGTAPMFMSVYNKINFTNDYYSFINSYFTKKSGTVSFAYKMEDNASTTTSSNEVELELTPEQQETIIKAHYVVFEREKGARDKYYKLIYQSNNAVFEGNKVRTNINNKLVKMRESDEKPEEAVYINIFNNVRDNLNELTSTAILIDKDLDYTDDNRMITGNILINDDNNQLSLGSMKKVTRDERATDVLYSLDNYEILEMIDSSPQILDSNGKVLMPSDWTYPNTRYGFDFDIKDVVLEYSGFGNDDYYVVFYFYDYNGNIYPSDLIKVGV